MHNDLILAKDKVLDHASGYINHNCDNSLFNIRLELTYHILNVVYFVFLIDIDNRLKN